MPAENRIKQEETHPEGVQEVPLNQVIAAAGLLEGRVGLAEEVSLGIAECTLKDQE